MRKGKLEIISFICILIALILSGCGSGSSNKSNPQSKVLLTLASNTVNPGDTFSRTVKVQNIGGTFYAAFDMTYDPEVIEYLDATEGTFLNRNGTDATSFQAALQDGKQGRITIGMTRLGPIGNVSGDGTLLTLTFRAVGPGSTSLAFADPKGFKDSANQDVRIGEWESGSVTVQFFLIQSFYLHSSNSLKYSSLLIPAVRIHDFIISRPISSYFGIMIGRLTPSFSKTR